MGRFKSVRAGVKTSALIFGVAWGLIQGNRISTRKNGQQVIIIPTSLEALGMDSPFGSFFVF